MKHDNILAYVGIETHLIRSEYWLITEYHEHGSLFDYLEAKTVTLLELFKISLSMVNGLMYLHDENPSGRKPAIAHRNFKSKNVLLKSDLTACIGDFGFSLAITTGN